MKIDMNVAWNLYECQDGRSGDFTWCFRAEQKGSDRRWSRRNLVVLEYTATGELWGFHYEEGLTENQESSFPWDKPWNGPVPTELELFPVTAQEVTKIIYAAS